MNDKETRANRRAQNTAETMAMALTVWDAMGQTNRIHALLALAMEEAKAAGLPSLCRTIAAAQAVLDVDGRKPDTSGR